MRAKKYQGYRCTVTIPLCFPSTKKEIEEKKMKSEISRSRSRIKSKQEFSHVNNNIPAPISQRFNNNFSIDFLIKKKNSLIISFILLPLLLLLWNYLNNFSLPSIPNKITTSFPIQVKPNCLSKIFRYRTDDERNTFLSSLSLPSSFLPPSSENSYTTTWSRKGGREDPETDHRETRRKKRNRDEIFSPSSSHVRNIRDDIGGCVH